MCNEINDTPTHTPTDCPNCRCVLVFMELPWLWEIDALLDRHIGLTDPRLPETTL